MTHTRANHPPQPTPLDAGRSIPQCGTGYVTNSKGFPIPGR